MMEPEMNISRHCEEQSDEAIQFLWKQETGLLRFARNDE